MSLITVLLPIYNAEKYLEECLQSIQNQTFKNFQVLMLEDGCTDKSEEIALEFQEKDNRFQWIPRKENLGISKTLNQGLKMADGQFIAIMNADDVNLPQRFEKQIQFMRENPDIISCGTQIEYFNNQEITSKYTVPSKSEDIFVEWIYRPALVHATSLTYKKAFNELLYNEDFLIGLDYHLWGEILLKGNLANLNDVLLQVRIHEHNVTKIYSSLKVHTKKQVFKIWLKRLKISPSDNDLQLHFHIFHGKDNIDINYLEKVGKWLETLYTQNQKTKIFPEPNFTNLLKQTWAKHTLGYSRLGYGLWKIWSKSPISEDLLTDFQRLKFWFKCLIKY